jgi:hypothetical protein
VRPTWGIDHKFDPWNYFFHVQPLPDLDMELAVSRGAIIHVKSGLGVDPYFYIHMPTSMNWWWKKWFYLRNDASVPLPAFPGSRPILVPSWGEGVARKDIDKL